MKFTSSTFNGSPDGGLKVAFLGDWHVGHISCNYEIIKAALAEIDLDRDNYRIILMGDLLEAATRSSVGAGIFETDLSIDGQIDRVIELLEPYSDLIDGLLDGNHEARIYKLTGIDVSKQLAARLGVPYLRYSGVVKYIVGGIRYTINAYHGSGGGGSTGNAVNKCKKMAGKVACDIYAMGHTHQLASSSRQFCIPKTVRFEEMTQHFILTGSALDYDEAYPDQMNLERVTPGFPIANLQSGTKKVSVRLVGFSA